MRISPAYITSGHARLVVVYLVISLLSCAPGAMPNGHKVGQPVEDLDARTGPIYLPGIIVVSEDFGSLAKANDLHDQALAPTADQTFIARILQSDIVDNFAEKGFSVTRVPSVPHKLCLTTALFYQPQEWPIANRQIHLIVQLSNCNGRVISEANIASENWFGNLGDDLGLSSNQMISDTAKQAVETVLSPFNGGADDGRSQ